MDSDKPSANRAQRPLVGMEFEALPRKHLEPDLDNHHRQVHLHQLLRLASSLCLRASRYQPGRIHRKEYYGIRACIVFISDRPLQSVNSCAHRHGGKQKYGLQLGR